MAGLDCETEACGAPFDLCQSTKAAKVTLMVDSLYLVQAWLMKSLTDSVGITPWDPGGNASANDWLQSSVMKDTYLCMADAYVSIDESATRLAVKNTSMCAAWLAADEGAWTLLASNTHGAHMNSPAA